MKKTFKTMSLLLAFIMILCQAWPAVQAKAAEAPGLKYTSKVIYIDGDSLGKYIDNCWIPSKNTTGYNVKYQITSGTDLISVSKNGKAVATGNGVGAAVVKVTYSKTGERDTTATFTVKVRRNAVDVKLTQKSVTSLDAPMMIGDKLTLQAAKSHDGSYAKNHYGLDNYRGVVNDTLKIESLTPDIISANGFTLTAIAKGTAKFVVKAYQYGENNFTGVQSKIYTFEVEDPQPTPTPTPEVSVKQTSLTTIELSTNTAYTSAPAVNSIKLNRIISNSSIPFDIREIKLDDTDKTKLIIETYALLNEGTDFEVIYNDNKYTFTSTDGKIASLKITPTQIEEMLETEIYVSCYDKDGVLLGKYDMLTAYNEPGLELIIESEYGYPAGDKYCLYTAGNTAKAKAIYHTYKYDNNGNEIGNLTTEATIVAIKATPAKVDSYQYTIASSLPSYTSSFVTNKNIEVGQQDKYVYFYIKNSKGEDISHEYTLTSSNHDILIVGNTIPTSGSGIMAEICAVSGVNSQAYVLVKKDNSTVDTLPVTIRAEAKLNKLELDKYNLTLSNTSTSSEIVKITLYDQYNQKMNSEYSYPAVTLLNAANASMKNQIENNFYTYVVVEDSKISFNAIALDAGTYTFKVELNGLSRAVTIIVVKPNESLASSYRLVLSASSVDAAISSTDMTNKELTFRIAEYKGSTLYRYLRVGEASPVVKDSKGNTCIITNDSIDTWIFTATDVNTNPVSKKENGTYYITVTHNKVDYKQSFTVTDSQGGIIAGLVNSSVTSPGTWENALAMAFDFTYLGTNVDSDIAIVNYTTNGGPDSKSAGSSISTGTYHINSVTFNVLIGLYSVPITVNVGRSIVVR